MPEGDTIRRTAATLDAALSGRVLLGVEGSHPAVRRAKGGLDGRRVERVRAYGKHVLVEIEGGTVLRSHLGMSGAWHVYRPSEPWRRSTGAARAVLRTDEWVAVCFAAPDVEVLPAHRLAGLLASLGPDLMDDGFDPTAFLERARARPAATTVAELVLHQRVAAGVGNEHKSEVLFLEGLHPEVTVGTLDDRRLLAIAGRARRLLLANRNGGARVTTGHGRHGHRLWVYGRAGAPCRRCGETVQEAWLGTPRRVTYWCPSCQPPPEP